MLSPGKGGRARDVAHKGLTEGGCAQGARRALRRLSTRTVPGIGLLGRARTGMCRCLAWIQSRWGRVLAGCLCGSFVPWLIRCACVC